MINEEKQHVSNYNKESNCSIMGTCPQWSVGVECCCWVLEDVGSKPDGGNFFVYAFLEGKTRGGVPPRTVQDTRYLRVRYLRVPYRTGHQVPPRRVPYRTGHQVHVQWPLNN